MPAATRQTATKQGTTREGAGPAEAAPRGAEKPRRFRAALEGYEGSAADAKRPETRQRRIEKSIRLLAAGRKEPR